jgi:hypothetical protein
MEQLSITTQAPGQRLGTRRVAAKASKLKPSKAPKITAEATNPDKLNPAWAVPHRLVGLAAPRQTTESAPNSPLTHR